MKTFTINTSGRESRIFVGSDIKGFRDLVPEHTVIITDEIVREKYGNLWKDYQTITIGLGEKNKTPATTEEIYRTLLEFGVDRSGYILGIGGGIVCDIAGFVASTYMRGVKFAFVPTTLLAQVDASIGGKNGVNFLGFKNMIGTFNQPEFILSDPAVLKTLPAEELANGFAEIVKHALIADEEMFKFIENNYQRMKNLHAETINYLIRKSVEIKTAIVNMDEREQGVRRKLNFGHTFGHAIEKVTGLSHGNAVSLGSVIAARISRDRGYISDVDFEHIRNVLINLGLPVEYHYKKADVLAALTKDKKREQEFLHFVLLDKIGEAFIEKIYVDELKQLKI